MSRQAGPKHHETDSGLRTASPGYHMGLRWAASGELGECARDLRTAMRGGLDGVSKIEVAVADDPQIDEGDAARKCLARDRIIEQHQRSGGASAQIGIGKARFVDRADCGRKLAGQHVGEHFAIALPEAFPHRRERVECRRDGIGPLLDHAGFRKRIVAADADNEMACVVRNTSKLATDVSHASAVEGVEGRPPPGRQDSAQLSDNVRIPGADIHPIVENGISEQDDVRHLFLSKTVGWKGRCGG